MDSRIPAIALKHVTYFGGGALLAVATVLGAQTAVADITIWKHLGGLEKWSISSHRLKILS